MSLKGKRRMVDNLILMPQKASIVDLYSYQARIVFSMYVNSLRYGYNYWKLTTNFQGNIRFFWDIIQHKFDPFASVV